MIGSQVYNSPELAGALTAHEAGRVETTEGGLLPCPFCGGEASSDGHIRYSSPLDETWWEDGTPITEAFRVNCVRCGAVSRGGIVDGYQTKAEAIAAWNTRATPPPAAAPDREAIARVIDPVAFSDAYIGNRALLRGGGIYARRAAKRDIALAKADAILALTAEVPAAPADEPRSIQHPPYDHPGDVA